MWVTSFSVRHVTELAAGFVVEQYRTANIRLTIKANLPIDVMVLGEQTMFEQVLVNLLINARDAFDMRETPSSDTSNEVRLSMSLQEGEVLISVKDNAGGIAEHLLPRIFEPFVTNKPADKGTGLGLSLSRSVIKDMRGTLTVKNISGGACFQIRLPSAPATTRHEEVPAS